jgi:hypothetical protein
MLDLATTHEPPPQRLCPDSSVVAKLTLAAGESHSLALKGDGTVWAWGANDAGQVGNNSVGQSRARAGEGPRRQRLAHRYLGYRSGWPKTQPRVTVRRDCLCLGCKRPRSGGTRRRLEAVIKHIAGQGSGGREDVRWRKRQSIFPTWRRQERWID